MPATTLFSDPEHWRQRAEAIRTLASEMEDTLAWETMLQVVRDYERLAVSAEERLARVRQAERS